jgi:ribonuclease III
LATNRLEKITGLRFRDRGLLQQALVHRSFLNEQGGSPLDSYERLEFLGDAVLELVISTELYRRLTYLTEGELTKGRAALVCGESLSQVAQRLNLGEFLLLGRGEEASGGRQRDSILAACFEAVVAAVYLDRGYEKARQFILRAMEKELEEFCHQGAPPDNPKSRLQEYFQGLGRPSPRYRMVSSQGPDHRPVFTIEVMMEEQVVGTGQGGKKADAERAAAQDALARLIHRVGQI